MGESQGKAIHQKLGWLIELNQDIGLRYHLSCELMEDPGVADCLRFLGELDHLALQYGFSPSEIIALNSTQLNDRLVELLQVVLKIVGAGHESTPDYSVKPDRITRP
ncbi:hypothetical protein [Pseudomonas sp. GM25]|uniref:hypothetical protein n=1 Tax=Pseudomonas sp. GM25 TaxID=1144327 RepID=UPI00026FF395|nr:hypothetical protein [Pseudomonas sp. GM25]EJM31291.1 hypothetical protein PMI24_00837 [Pseudomonas sp. GM25]